MVQVTVMTGPQRRRRWSDAERVEIVEAAFAPGVVVADVARRFEVSTSLIYKWRRGHASAGEPAFLPAMVVDASDKSEFAAGSGGVIVVHLAGGARVMIGASAPVALVGATLKALKR